jgi:hypothetical protein
MIVSCDLLLHQGVKYPAPEDVARFTWRSGTPDPVTGDPPLVDLTGYTAKLQVRPFVDSTDVLLSLTSGAGITLGGVAGTIDLAVTAIQTAAIGRGVYPYDLVLIPGGVAANQFVYASGFVRVEPLISRS